EFRRVLFRSLAGGTDMAIFAPALPLAVRARATLAWRAAAFGLAFPLFVGPSTALLDLLLGEAHRQQAHGEALLDSGLHLHVNAVRALRLQEVEQIPALAPLIIELDMGLGRRQPDASLLVRAARR